MRQYKPLLRNSELLIFILIIPIIQFLEFYLSGAKDVLEYTVGNSLIPYVNIVVFIIIIYKSRFEKKQLFLLLVLVFYSLFFKNSFANNASYMINIVITCSLLLFFTDSKIEELSKNQEKILICFSISLIFLYYYFSSEKFYEDRFYLVGFIIPHQFSYYCAFLLYYFINKKKFLVTIFIGLAGIYVGVRSGFLAILISSLSYFRTINTNKKATIVFKILLASLFLYLAIGSINNKSFEKIDTLISNTFNTNKQGQDEYTASRSIIWFNLFEQVKQDGISFQNIIGRGPRSSYEFNNRKIGVAIWMHNDILDILFSLGAFGVFIYVFSFYKYLTTYKDLISLFLFLVLVFTNGFFTYSPLTLIVLHRLAQNNIINNA
ncbi:O-antigen ligase-like membrane protein [Flavobacterium sp. 270]|uniref:O-antigen ligase family protein n=1 Tax=Flavobacterium sp. 270 TaxID=2512114 RepID=UPI001065BC43|nr:O-antigen ligase family protein [Flavobacterium sp. 270]TDW48588.1 O-antigen ligase-like membrane protein [Flavobacterium sp. 270]